MTNIIKEIARYEDYSLLTMEEVESRRYVGLDQILESALLSAGSYAAVAEVQEDVVGLVELRGMGLSRCKHVVELGVGVLPAYTGRGIGTALLRHALDWATRYGYLKVRLLVIATNARAIHVYEKLGFKESGRFEREVRTSRGLVDLLIMERFLR